MKTTTNTAAQYLLANNNDSLRSTIARILGINDVGVSSFGCVWVSFGTGHRWLNNEETTALVADLKLNA
jgi:hypothetical protein